MLALEPTEYRGQSRRIVTRGGEQDEVFPAVVVVDEPAVAQAVRLKPEQQAPVQTIGPINVSALIEHDAVVECAVTAAPDPVRGMVVKATVVLARGWEPSEALIKELQNHVKKTTAPYKYPRIVEFTDELPKTIGGKIKRKLIRQTDGVEE